MMYLPFSCHQELDHGQDKVVLEENNLNFTLQQKHTSNWSDFLALAIGTPERDHFSKSKLIGIHKSGQVLDIVLPHCFKCEVHEIIAGN